MEGGLLVLERFIEVLNRSIIYIVYMVCEKKMEKVRKLEFFTVFQRKSVDLVCESFPITLIFLC